MPSCTNQDMVICAKHKDYSHADSCISFWLISNGCEWILCCWSCRYWIIPDEADVLPVVESYLQSDGDFTHVPDNVVEMYKLVEISAEDPRLALAMRYGVSVDAPIDDLSEFLETQLQRSDLAETRKSFEEFDIESHVRTQLQNKGPLFVGVEGAKEYYPGVSRYKLSLSAEQCIYAPGTGDILPSAVIVDRHSAWVELVSDFAHRYNIVMYFEASMIGKFPVLAPSLESIKQKYRIKDSAWRNMSIESKLLLQANEIECFRLKKSL